jgi:murein DD-endopeptidase MepM/ murein hydrolase activator NlpD
METDEDGNGVADGWSLNIHQGAEGAAGLVPRIEGHEARCQHVVHTNASSEWVRVSQEPIPAVPGHLYALSAGSDDSVERIWDFDESADPDIKELRKLRSILPDEIFTLRQLQREFICTTNAVKAVKNFIDVRSKVINDTPSIVPNAGNITSLFGWRRSPFGFGRDFHTGIDIAAAGGTPIRVTAPGMVEATGWAGGYGYMVRVRHKYGFETVYAHCSAIYVGKGQSVSRGQVIAAVGQTGNATGNHCHYEVRLGNTPINPYPYMRKIW